MTAPSESTSPARTLLAGMNSNSAMVRRLVSDPRSQVTRLTDVPAMAILTTDTVDLEFTGPRSIPQLRIRGRLEAIVATNPDELPYALTQVSLPSNESVDIDAVYHFTTDQIVEMVNKGLYLEGFGPAESWLGLAMELPVSADITLVAPTRTGEPPIVGVDVNKLAVIDTSRDHSMYEFASAFGDYRGDLINSGVMPENDIPGEFLEAEISEEGFDFGRSSAEELPTVQIVDANVNLTAARAQMEELIGVHLVMPDQLAILAAEERARDRDGVGAKAREGLVGRGEQASLSEFNASMRERVLAFGGKSSAGIAGLSDDEMLQALDGVDDDAEFESTEFDFDLSGLDEDGPVAPEPKAPAAEEDLEGFDFGDLDEDQTQELTPEQEVALVSVPEPITDTESIELDELEAAELEDDEADSEEERARKAAMRARRARLIAARRVRERARKAAEAAAIAERVTPAPVIEAPESKPRHSRSTGPELG